MQARKETRVLRADDPESLARAGEALRAGKLVAFPTETVYGLGANALDATAVGGIFRAKGRPSTDPLIVHLRGAAGLPTVSREPGEAALRLAERFWPGPLTLVLRKAAGIPLEVTAGRQTVGVRVPDHPAALALLRAARLPIAAPSANLFGRPSPTQAAHVLEDLDGRIDFILDGGPTRIGVESTIVDLSGAAPRLLRPGGTPVEAVEAVLGRTLLPPPGPGPGAQEAPGLLPSHYAPRTPLVLVLGPPSLAYTRLQGAVRAALGEQKRVGVLLLDEDDGSFPSDVVAARVGAYADAEGVAARLFDALRALDRAGLDILFSRLLADPSSGLGRALADRLRRASVRRIE